MKNYFKLELRDYQVFNNLLYIKTCFYVLSNKNNILYTLISIKYASQLLIYDCLSQ